MSYKNKKDKNIKELYVFAYVASDDNLDVKDGKLTFLNSLKSLGFKARFVFMFAEAKPECDQDKKTVSMFEKKWKVRCEYSVHGQKEFEIIAEELNRISSPENAVLFFSGINEKDIKSDEFELPWKRNMNAVFNVSFSETNQAIQKKLAEISNRNKKSDKIAKMKKEKVEEMMKKAQSPEDISGLDVDNLMGGGVKIIDEETPPEDPEAPEEAIQETQNRETAQKSAPSESVDGRSRHTHKAAKGQTETKEKVPEDDSFSISQDEIDILFDSVVSKMQEKDRQKLYSRFADVRAVFVQILFDVTAQEILMATRISRIRNASMESFISLLATADSAENFEKSWPNISGEKCPLKSSEYISDSNDPNERNMLFSYMKRCAVFYSSVSQLLYGIDLLAKNEEWRKKRKQAISEKDDR